MKSLVCLALFGLQVAASEVRHLNVPIITRCAQNALIEIKATNPGEILESVEVELSGSLKLEEIQSVELVALKEVKDAMLEYLPAMAQVTEPKKKSLTLQLSQATALSDKSLFVSVKLKDKANIDSRLGITVKRLKLNHGLMVPQQSNPPILHRIGVGLRLKKDDAVCTYRIPGLATSKKGTLLAIYDVRYRSNGDLPGDIDVGLSRSHDGGQSWEAMKVVMDMGNDPKFQYDGVGDPAILVDEKTGRIWLSALWSHGKRGWFGSGAGLTSDETGQFMLCFSDDDGLTWSKPRSITPTNKKPEWKLFFNGPGAGICTQSGALVFAAQYKDATGVPHSTILSSQDRGETWKTGIGIKSNTTEAQVIELKDGSLMLNCRDDRGGSRTVGVSKDWGDTWALHSSDRSALIEPICMASLLRMESEMTGNLFVFSNPHHSKDRSSMSLQVSKDEGATWKVASTYDERKCWGYSCLSPIGKDKIGVFYEGAGDLYFLRIPMKELIETY